MNTMCYSEVVESERAVGFKSFDNQVSGQPIELGGDIFGGWGNGLFPTLASVLQDCNKS